VPHPAQPGQPIAIPQRSSRFALQVAHQRHRCTIVPSSIVAPALLHPHPPASTLLEPLSLHAFTNNCSHCILTHRCPFHLLYYSFIFSRLTLVTSRQASTPPSCCRWPRPRRCKKSRSLACTGAAAATPTGVLLCLPVKTRPRTRNSHRFRIYLLLDNQSLVSIRCRR
jgi:hypothetical protein